MTFKGIDSLNGKPPAEIKHIIMMGDSLSDRGTLNKAVLFGCIPMASVSGLKGHSPDGRFTNGLVWSDHVSAQIASDFTIKRLQKRLHLDDTDIADAVINHDRRILSTIRNGYSLDDDKFINYQGKVWIRSYCEGGLMAHDYSWALSSSIVRFFTRLIVSTLAEMREKVLNYDKKHHISGQQKEETLIVEWSGANDLVTVNAEPSIEEVDKAITARMDNVKKLISAGYRNFVVFNLPNIALTPRYQAKSKAEQDNAQKCTTYFNAELEKACDALNKDYPHCSVDAFDINTMFENIYHHPQKYLLAQGKLKVPYISSPDFNDPSDGISASTGYMFYDDLHPTADIHALLASYFYDRLSVKYELLEPNKQRQRRRMNLSEDAMLRCFRKHYEEKLKKDQHSFFGGLKKSQLNYKAASLETILRHALKENGTRTFDTLVKLGWLDKAGQLILTEPVLKKAMAQVDVPPSTVNATYTV